MNVSTIFNIIHKVSELFYIFVDLRFSSWKLVIISLRFAAELLKLYLTFILFFNISSQFVSGYGGAERYDIVADKSAWIKLFPQLYLNQFCKIKTHHSMIKIYDIWKDRAVLELFVTTALPVFAPIFWNSCRIFQKIIRFLTCFSCGVFYVFRKKPLLRFW